MRNVDNLCEKYSFSTYNRDIDTRDNCYIDTRDSITTHNMASEKYISLKEAASLSGYSADYIGQLIRKGKLEGKQVFSHVAWTTTEKSLQTYMEQVKKTAKEDREHHSFGYFLAYMTSRRVLSHIMEVALYGVIVFSVMLSLFFFYITSVSIDKSIDEKVIERITMDG